MFIRIEKNTDGSHAFQIGGNLEVGWAYVPNNMAIPDTFPYVNIEVEEKYYPKIVEKRADGTERIFQEEHTQLEVVSMTEGEEIIPPLTVDDLRSLRSKQCFPYINRGELWYARLTAEQKEELTAWYQAWLDVTETNFIPGKPEWLK